jgi:type II secretory pathway component PulJ
MVMRRWFSISLKPSRMRDVYRRDAGTSLLELVVGMTLMGVFLTMFSGAITLMYTSANKSQALTDTSAELNQAFNRLDSSVRYASAISQPGRSAANDWYVEFQTTNTAAVVCTQLRINHDVRELQQRTWTVVNSSASNESGWVSIASYVINGGAPAGLNQPFIRMNPSTTTPYEALQFQLQVKKGDSQTASTSATNLTFVALNSTASTPPTGICAEKARS